jgi:hypothetical protein
MTPEVFKRFIFVYAIDDCEQAIEEGPPRFEGFCAGSEFSYDAWTQQPESKLGPAFVAVGSIGLFVFEVLAGFGFGEEFGYIAFIRDPSTTVMEATSPFFVNFEFDLSLRKYKNPAGLQRNRHVQHVDHDAHNSATFWLQ